MDDDLQRLSELLQASRRTVVFTGAGISTEAGIPDFRSPRGSWTRVKAIDFSDYLASAEARREAWRQKLELGPQLSSAEPNRGHLAVAELARRACCRAVIAQKVDTARQRAGVAGELVIEPHGSNTSAACLDCGLRHELEPLLAAFARDETLPQCRGWGGIVKSATVSFGQPMPEEAMNRAEQATLDCDLFLAVGSSLVVYPAAGFPLMAARIGAKLVILNREPTEL